MENTLGMVQKSKKVVGLDFGTTFSGFAYALRADPDQIYTLYNWPMQAEAGGLPYCKTQTSLLYADASEPRSDDPFQLLEWGWPAFVIKSSSADSTSDASVSRSTEVLSLTGGRKKASRRQHFVKLFKLLLATKGSTSAASDSTSAPTLPHGLTARRAITDYLRQISMFVLQEVRNKFGANISLDDTEWCLTVPAIWDEHAKKEMRECSELADLVQGPLGEVGAGSPHPLKLFIEPEAASVYCQQKVKDHTWSKGDKFLVVDCGGGTVDLVLHEKLGSGPSVSVREVQESSGDFCGGSQVDAEFFKFLRNRISCFERFRREYPATVLAFFQDWEKVKNGFAGEATNVHLELPPKLAEMWEADRCNSSLCYDEMLLTSADMKTIFEPVVSKILLLISLRLVLGLWSGDHGNPVGDCCFESREENYGTNVAVPFTFGMHPKPSPVIIDDSGRHFCRNVFRKFVKKGDEVLSSNCVKNVYVPLFESQTAFRVGLYSIDCCEVSYVTDPCVELEGELTAQFPSGIELGSDPEVELSIFFGRDNIEVSVEGLNFDSPKQKMLSVKFDRHSILQSHILC